MRSQTLRFIFGSTLAVALCACRALPTNPAPSTSNTPSPTPARVSATSFVCADGERAMQRETLYFGRSRADGGTVSDAQWRAFVDDAIVGEATHMVIVLHAGDAAAHRAVDEIVAQYKLEFVQESVLRERMPTCAKF